MCVGLCRDISWVLTCVSHAVSVSAFLTLYSDPKVTKQISLSNPDRKGVTGYKYWAPGQRPQTTLWAAVRQFRLCDRIRSFIKYCPRGEIHSIFGIYRSINIQQRSRL